MKDIKKKKKSKKVVSDYDLLERDNKNLDINLAQLCYFEV